MLVSHNVLPKLSSNHELAQFKVKFLSADFRKTVGGGVAARQNERELSTTFPLVSNKKVLLHEA